MSIYGILKAMALMGVALFVIILAFEAMLPAMIVGHLPHIVQGIAVVVALFLGLKGVKVFLEDKED